MNSTFPPHKNAADKSAEKNAAPGAVNAARFTIKETKLMGQLGAHRDRIRELRHAFLKQGEHWELIGNRVMLSEAGAEILRQKKSAALPAPEKNAAPSPASNAAQPQCVKGLLTFPPSAKPFDGTLIAWAMPKINQRVLIAYRPGTDPLNPLNLVPVRVASNVNFMRGDQITARQVSSDVFDLVGPCPRVRGEFKRKAQLKTN